jgi:hypothetical protein
MTTVGILWSRFVGLIEDDGVCGCVEDMLAQVQIGGQARDTTTNDDDLHPWKF